MALVTPWPPAPTGVAAYSARLAAELGELGPLDVYVDAAPHHRGAMADGARPLGAFERMEALAGRYDAVVYALGNSEHHTGALAALRRRPGVVEARPPRPPLKPRKLASRRAARGVAPPAPAHRPAVGRHRVVRLLPAHRPLAGRHRAVRLPPERAVAPRRRRRQCRPTRTC